MSRKSGCPFNIRNYQVDIKNLVTDEFVRVKGLDTMSVDVDSETDDGKAGDAFWSETYIQSRSASGSIGGRPIADRTTGTQDAGQLLMHKAAFNEGGCDNDQTLRIADAVGHAVEYDCVITKESRSSDEDGEEISWDWEGVGSPREIPYVQASGVAFKNTTTTITTLSVTAGATGEVAVEFTPTDASNQRYTYYIDNEAVATVAAVDGNDISIKGIAAGTATLSIKTMNNALTANLAITVTAT